MLLKNGCELTKSEYRPYASADSSTLQTAGIQERLEPSMHNKKVGFSIEARARVYYKGQPIDWSI